MRRFLVLAHDAPLDPGFHLDDLPGGAGRLDVLCRAVGATLLLSHDIRRDVEAILLLRNSIRIRILGDRVKRLNPDERSTAALLRRAIDSLADDEVESTRGVFAARSTLQDTIDDLIDRGACPIVLDEGGLPVDSFRFPADPAFVLSDHADFSSEEARRLADFPHVSLGSTPLHTSQAITIAHFLLDRKTEAVEENLVLAHKVWGEPKALMIKGLLEDFEIPANLVTHASPSIYPMALDGLAEVRIMVRARDLSRAQQIISDYFEPATGG
jgi:tRNA (pseudouridine54-N1)-methyltransferase